MSIERGPESVILEKRVRQLEVNISGFEKKLVEADEQFRQADVRIHLRQQALIKVITLIIEVRCMLMGHFL